MTIFCAFVGFYDFLGDLCSFLALLVIFHELVLIESLVYDECMNEMTRFLLNYIIAICIELFMLYKRILSRRKIQRKMNDDIPISRSRT